MNQFKCLLAGILLTGLIPSAAAVDIASKPVFLNPPDPRIMLVMSRDHELSKKAYNDTSDLNGDGVLEITYADTVEYYGYFDTKRCYTYSSANSRFEPGSAATGANSHHCSGEWSGNFLNWVSMTRMDVLRKTLYGGLRSTDNNGTALGDTVLERAYLPNDVHAFSKTFAPSAGNTDVAKYTPYTTNAVVSFCNVTSGSDPVIQVVAGSSGFPRWAMAESTQCGTGSGDKPATLTATLNVRVAVCVTGKLEDNCTTYGTNNKPTGLLQKYGESTALSRIQFGLLTGSYSKNKSGGVLRKNTSWLTNNTTASNNEINPSTGQFINQSTTDTGIINTINRIRIAGWNGSKHANGCGSPGILSFSNGECVDWGNPLSEMYLETLRYFAGKSGPTSAFDSTTSEQTHLPSIPKVTWSDPLPSTQWCAVSNTVVLSTGLNSFDTDQLTSDITGLDPTALTDAVGTAEGISGSYLIGSNGISGSDDNQCSAKTLTSFSTAKGICPEVPSLEGGYHLAGLAYANQQVDLRPGYQTLRNQRWGTGSSNPNAAFAARQPMGTYTVALAESLPKLDIPVAGGSITFLPACMANSNVGGSAISNANPPVLDTTSGWRVCSLTDLRILNLTLDGSGNATTGSLEASWEDSTWGNDYDMDGVAQLDFCIGTACSPAVASNQLTITAQVVYANAGHSLRFGYTVTGSTQNGTYLDILRRGGVGVPTLGPKDGVTGPTSRTFTAGLSSAKLLENPLWYAAKYARPDWDTKGGGVNKDQPDTVPDNFFKVTNPAGLFTALGEVFEGAAVADASASAIASNSTRLDTNTHIYQALFQSPGWTGDIRALPLTASGTGSVSWTASAGIPAAASRNIKTWNGGAWNVGAGVDFVWSSTPGTGTLTAAQLASIGSADILAYIRGDQTKEQTSPATAGKIFRKRRSLMGDIVNSDPHYVATESFGYDQINSGLSATVKALYTTFQASKSTRKQMLYVGANDGMLHAINAANTSAAGGGNEVFTYVPSAVIGGLATLSSPTYQHRYFVDGSPSSGDAYLGGAWKTILLGTLGAGGKAVFALDVTDPDAFDASKVIWEFTDTTDLGNVMGKAQVARMNDGNWYAIFGNGYNSSSQKAVLFLVPLDRSLSLPVIKIDTGVAADNGLSEPALLDTNGDRIIDSIYAGDLKGNVWKFDVSGINTTSGNAWVVAYKTGSTPSPLFNASIGTNVQPITGPLEIGVAPSGTSGYMIYFGTGKYMGSSDVGTTATQSAYGILDAGAKLAGRSDLQAQTFVFEGARSGSDPRPIRVVSSNTFAYTGGSKKSGWYLDLISPNTPSNLGERMISVPLLRHGRAIFTTIIPSAEQCELGGTSWITEVDALTGGRLSYSVFDYTNDNLFNASDYATYTSGGSSVSNPVSSRKLETEGLMKSPTVISAGEKEYKVGSGTAGGVVIISEKGTTGRPRTSWRQINPQ